jgi:predicted dehydrogenase/aryl-alcohol dehydrogenase-like predicted oxidoreductase
MMNKIHSKKLRWGILGAGGIGGTFAQGVAHSETGTVVAVGSRRRSSAEDFGKKFGIPRCHDSYAALLEDPDVDAVYIALPHPMHARWSILAAEAGKHVLCEKPAGLNHAEVMAMTAAAREHDVFFMEAFMYRCHPQTARLARLIREGAIGQVRLIRAAFSFHTQAGPESRLIDPELGGGGILDVGCYPVSMSRLLAGVAQGRAFLDPDKVDGTAVLEQDGGIDAYASAVLTFPGGILAEVSCGVRLRQDNVLRVYGTEGWLEVPEPWIPPREGGESVIHLHPAGGASRTETVRTDAWLYGLEADTVARYLDARQAPSMSWDDSLGNARTLDRWRAGAGLVYPQEKPGYRQTPLHGRPLSRRPDAPMTYGTIPGSDKQVSRLFMGCDNQQTQPHADVLFDDFFEKGGNAFDTAWIYGGGLQERLLGHWIRSRNVREQIYLLGKGAHTPDCDPEGIDRQLAETLDRLQTDRLDLYLLHRDNPDVPVGEFIDALNRHVRAGRIGAFGGSNWTTQRIDEANAYARAKGWQGMTVVSNNFSLARMVDPVWEGCMTASDPASREWFTRTGTTLLAWSSQARGFFTERAGRDLRSDAELVRCWYAEDNFLRRDRVLELARTKGVLPINIALAYVLCQPFPTFALIGPRTLEETRTSLPGLGVHLTPDEMAWLNLEA